jgi:hypothetical protein
LAAVPIAVEDIGLRQGNPVVAKTDGCRQKNVAVDYFTVVPDLLGLALEQRDSPAQLVMLSGS